MRETPGVGATAPVGALARALGPRRLWWALGGLALGILLLALAARGIDRQALGRAFQQADPLWVGAGLLAVLLTTAAKVGRWRRLFRPSAKLRYRSLARALVVGQLVNALLPARLGEVARFYTLGRDEGVSQATVVGTIAAEKAFDVLFLLLTAGLAAALASLPPWLGRSLATAAALGVAVFLAAVALPHRWVGAALERVTSWLPRAVAARLSGLLERGLAGLESLRRPRLAAAACAWSALVWALAAGTNLVLFRAFHLPLSLGAALLLLTLLHVGTAPPSSPGRLGVFHALTVLGLQSLVGAQGAGIDRAAALAYATVLHAVVYGPQLVLGALALGLSPRPRGADR